MLFGQRDVAEETESYIEKITQGKKLTKDEKRIHYLLCLKKR